MQRPTTPTRRSLKTARTAAAAALASAAWLQVHAAVAGTLAWDPNHAPATPSGGTGTWDTNTTPNWAVGASDTVWTDTTGTDTAVFGGAAGTVTLASTETANRLVFNTSGYLLTGGTLNLAGTTPTITANASATIASNISGSIGLTLGGTGTLTLTGTNAYAGTTTIGSGSTLQVGNGGNPGSLGTGTVVDNGTLAFYIAAANLPAGITGTGSLSVNANTTTFNGNVALGGSQTYNAGNINGQYVLAANTTLTGSSITMSGAVGENAPGYSHLFAVDTSATNGPINLNLGFTVTNYYYPIGSFSANAGTGSLTLTNTTGYTVNKLTALSLTGALNVNDTVADAGNFSLHATGNSTVAGTFGLDQNHAYYAYDPFTVDAGSTMTVSAQLTGVSGTSYGGISKLGGGTLVLTNATNTYGQGVDLGGGTVQFTNNALIAASSGTGNGGYTADFVASSTLKFDATDTTDISTGGLIDIANGVTATFDTNGSTQTFGTAFSLKSGAAAAVVVNDSNATPGTLIIAANNTYTGGTTITRGTLQVGNGGTTGSLGTGAIVDNGTLAYNFGSGSAQLILPPAAGLSGTGNLNVIAPTTAFAGNVTLGGSQIYNPGNTGAAYNVSTSTKLTGSSISITGLSGQPAANSGYTLALDTSAVNGPITVNMGFSVPNVSYTLAGFTANAGTGVITLTDTTTSANFPAVSSLTGALNINDTLMNAGAIALHATGASTVAGTIGLDQSLNGYNAFTVDAGVTMTVSAVLAPVSGSSYGGINKLGGGTLLLTNSSNSYQQGLQLNGGTVQFLNNALPAARLGQGGYAADFLANSTLKFDATDTADVSGGGEIDIASGVTATFDTNGSTQIFGSAFALKSGTAAAVVVNDTNATPGKLVIAANNAYTGGTTITRGTLQVGNGGTTGSLGTGAIVDNGTLAYNFSGSAQLALPPAAGLSGTGNLNVITPTTAFVANVTLGGSQIYNAGNTGAAYNVSTSAKLTGSSISITGLAGQPGANSGNTLTLDTSAANGPITANLGFSVPNISYPLAGFTANAGTGVLTLTNTTATNLYFPAVSSLTGALNINEAIADAGSLALHATANSTVAGSIGLDQADPVTTYYGYNSFTVDAGATMTVSAQLSGVFGKSYGGINKLGAGTLVLSNANNNYSNGTVIMAGTVRAEAAAASLGTGPVNIGAGVLAGSGNTGTGVVTLNSGGTITAGTGATAADSIGTLTVGAGGLTLDGGTYIVKLDLAHAKSASAGGGGSVNTTSGGPASDQLLVSGLLEAGASAALTVSPLALSSSAVSGTTYSFVILDAQGSGNSSAFDYAFDQISVTPTDARGDRYSLSYGNDSSGGEELFLDVTAAAATPEPTSLLLAGLAAAPLVMGRRRRRSTVA